MKLFKIMICTLIAFTVFSVMFWGEGATGAAASPITIKLGHIWAPEHPLHKAAVKLAEEVNQKTQEQVTIEVFPASQLGSETEQWEAVSTGLQHMTIGGFGFKWDSRFTLMDIPYAIKDLNHLKKVWNGEIGEELNQSLIEKANIRILGSWYYGTRRLTTSKKIVRAPEDVQGFKLRIPNMEAHRVGWSTIGASPTPIAFSETYLALKQGVVDGQENPLASIGAMKFYEVQKYLIMTNHVTQAVQVAINEQFYQGLPQDVQTILKDLVIDIAAYEEGLQKEVQEKWLKVFKEAGMEIIEPDREAFMKAAAAVKDVFTEKYNWGDLWDRVQALKD
jgi:tripartite ATP-independent transporter DctP family solute receptor